MIAAEILFTKIPSDFQWIMAIILPLVRELNSKILNNLLDRSRYCDAIITKLVVTIVINCVHAFFNTMAISFFANQLTTWCILGADFIVNIIHVVNIIRLYRKIVPDDLQYENKFSVVKDEVKKWFVIEMIEVLVPIAFMLTFLIAYYGPNATLIGNVRSNYFQYKEIKDVPNFLEEPIIMLVLDLGNAITGGILLWMFCSIDFMIEGYYFLKIFFPFLAASVAGKVTHVIYHLILSIMFIHLKNTTSTEVYYTLIEICFFFSVLFPVGGQFGDGPYL